MTVIIAAMFSGRIFDWLGVRDWAALGVAAGVAGHGIATAQILSINQNAGAFAGLSIGLKGLFTAVLLPIATHLLPLFVRVG
jgi:putative effector of murein hydrolase